MNSGSYRVKVNAFGRDLEITHRHGQWTVFDPGGEGKKRRATDVVIPGVITESGLLEYLADLLHEHANERYPEVKLLE